MLVGQQGLPLVLGPKTCSLTHHHHSTPFPFSSRSARFVGLRPTPLSSLASLAPSSPADIDMPLNLLTIGDHLSKGGWATSAYGKWDAGMTTWGSTPTCRGFDHFAGFYSAASDYFTHMVGPGFDYHNDLAPAPNASGIYTTERVTTDVQAWITAQVGAHDAKMQKQKKKKTAAAKGGKTTTADAIGDLKTFAYVAHEAVSVCVCVCVCMCFLSHSHY